MGRGAVVRGPAWGLRGVADEVGNVSSSSGGPLQLIWRLQWQRGVAWYCRWDRGVGYDRMARLAEQGAGGESEQHVNAAGSVRCGVVGPGVCSAQL